MQKISFLSQKFSWKKFAKNLVSLKAYADEIPTGGEMPPAPQSPNPVPTEVVNYEKLIAKARQEEKDKLYGEITRLKSEKDLLTKQSNESLLRAGRLEQELEDFKKNSTSNEEVTKLKAEIEALKEENKKLKESTPDEKKLREELTKEFEVKAYITEKLNENKGKILSVYVGTVTGKTKAEVDEAIKKAVEQSDAIRKEVSGGNETPPTPTPPVNNNNPPQNTASGYNALFNNTVQKTGVIFPTMPPAPNPSAGGSGGEGKFDAAYVANLDPRSEEYKKFRESIGLK